MNNNLFKIIVFASLCISLFSGLKQISSQKNILSDVRSHCCDNGVCNENPCSWEASISLKSNDCDDQEGFTCQDCMDYIGANQVCEVSPYYTFC